MNGIHVSTSGAKTDLLYRGFKLIYIQNILFALIFNIYLKKVHSNFVDKYFHLISRDMDTIHIGSPIDSILLCYARYS